MAPVLPALRPAGVSRTAAALASVAASASRGFSTSAPRRTFSSYLVTPKEVHEALQKSPPSSISTDPRVICLSAAWFLPNDPEGRTGIESYRQARIPRSRFFDLDKVIDRHSPYPHMLPDPKGFASAMSELGVRRDDTVVVYDTKELGIFSAPRVAWTLRAFGHPKVHLLNNFRLWCEQGLPIESGNLYNVECCTYPIPELDHTKVADFEEVREVALDFKKEGAEGVQVLDARSAGRFDGTADEPRPGLSSGHMPGAVNVPVDSLLDPKTKAFLPADQLKKIFQDRGVDPTRPIISSCGTGVTACVIDAALSEAQYGSAEQRKIYDGSWTEWAQRVKPSDSLIRKSTD